MKKNLIILIAFFSVSNLHGQIKKLDCYRGNYLTLKNGFKTANAFEQQDINEIYLLLSKTSDINLNKLKSISIDFSKKYKKFININQSSRTEFIEHADYDGKCYFERSYYYIDKNNINYYFQLQILMDLHGFIKNISILEYSTITKRDNIIMDKEKTKKDIIIPPPPTE